MKSREVENKLEKCAGGAFLRRIIHLAADPGIKIIVAELTERLDTVERLTLGLSYYFAGDDYTDIADAVKYGVETTVVEFGCGDGC